MSHLADPYLNLTLVPCAAAVLAGIASILWETGVLPGPRWMVYITLYAMIALIIAMTAVMRRSEYRADRGAVSLTPLSDVLAMLAYVATQPGPPRWQRFIATHPTTRQRIERLSELSAAAGHDAGS